MLELERDLREVGRLLAFPPEPELVPAVRARLGDAPRRFARRRVLVLALAALVVALAPALAAPPPRTALLRSFQVGGVTVARAETLARAAHRSPVAGRAGPVSLEQAIARAGFRPLVPPRDGGIGLKPARSIAC